MNHTKSFSQGPAPRFDRDGDILPEAPFLPAGVFQKVRAIPGQDRLPLSTDEQLAQAYAHNPARLMQLAEATGNRGLRNIALSLLQHKRDRRKVYV